MKIENEEEALEAISTSSDPMVRVIYNMGMRQLATSERIMRVEDELMRMSGDIKRIADKVGVSPSNGSRPSLRAMKVEG